MASRSKDVLVVGGGVIGLSAAYYLVRAGHSVRVVERDPGYGRSCSEGNAGMIVPSHFIPLAAPGVIVQGLRWMLNPKSPFSLKPSLDLDLARWIWLFYRNANAGHVARSEGLLRDMSLESRRLHVALASEESFDLVQRGLIMLCQTQKGLDEEAEVAEAAERLGIGAEVCDRARIAELEPGGKIEAQGGVWFKQDCHLSPGDFLTALRNGIVKGGGEFIEGDVQSVRDGGVQLSDGRELKAEEVVLAGGIATRSLAKNLGLKLLMQGGKGYSLTLREPKRALEICTLLKEGRVAVTPMGKTLRVAGTMELCGEDTSISRPRLEGIIESFCRFYPQFEPGDFEGIEPWVGLRPCSPDGLPYIGRHKGVIIATGHSMMGLSLAPVTGLLVAQLVSGEKTEVSLSALKPDRFG
jgi:D-amino-acid dehydrogenase